MDDYRNAVDAAIEEGIEVTYVDCDLQENDEMKPEVLYRAQAINPGTYLNLRSGPSTKYAAIKRIPRGEFVDVIEETSDEWLKVIFDGTTGYAMSRSGEETYLMPLDKPDADTADKNDEAAEDKWLSVKAKAQELIDAINQAMGDGKNGE